MNITEISNLYYQLIEEFAQEHKLLMVKYKNFIIKLAVNPPTSYDDGKLIYSYQEIKNSPFKYHAEQKHHQKLLSKLIIDLNSEERITLMRHWNLVESGTLKQYHEFIRNLELSQDEKADLVNNLSDKSYQSGGNMNIDNVINDIKKTVGEKNFHTSFLSFMKTRYKKQNNTEAGALKFRDCLIKEFSDDMEKLQEYVPLRQNLTK